MNNDKGRTTKQTNNAQRCKEYRARKRKAANGESENDEEVVKKVRKTASQRNKEYRARKKAAAISANLIPAVKVKKTAAQLCKEYRQRKKERQLAALLNPNPTSNTNVDHNPTFGESANLSENNTAKSGAQRTAECRKRKRMLEELTRDSLGRAFELADKEFNSNFYENDLGYPCSVFDRLWFRNDITLVNGERCINALRAEFPNDNVEHFKMPTRWGIVSAGRISNDFTAALKSLPEEEHIILGVAARNIDNAKDFANKYSIPNFYGSYEKLFKNPEIDVVYIGVLHPQHFEVAKRSLECGKNVLCEKPLCMNEKETTKLVELAKEKNLFLMEAVWSRCFPVYEHLRTLLANKAVGDVLHLNVQFGSKIDVDRMWKKELGGGTVLDLGIYTLQLATLVFGNKPSTVVASGHLNKEGVDQDMAAILTYPSGATAVLSTHSRVRLPNTATIVGTKGSIEIQAPFWAPTKITLSGESFKEEKEFPLPKSSENFNFVNSVGLSYEAIEVRRCLIADLLESPLVSHEDSIHLARLEDEIRRQLGVHYPQDDE